MKKKRVLGDKPIKNVHEFGRAIQENKHLYSDTEFMALCGEWLVEYKDYLKHPQKVCNYLCVTVRFLFIVIISPFNARFYPSI